MTAMEMINHPARYNITDANYANTITNIAAVISPYKKLSRSVTKNGRWAEMKHIYALSSAMNEPIQSYFPPSFAIDVCNPFTTIVVGHGVRKVSTSNLAIM